MKNGIRSAVFKARIKIYDREYKTKSNVVLDYLNKYKVINNKFLYFHGVL